MKFIPDGVSQKAASALVKARAHSPRVFFVAGVAGVVGGTVMACRATLRFSETKEAIVEDIDAVKLARGTETLDEGEYRKQLTMAYVRGGTELAKLYGPSVLVSGVGLGLLTGSHIQLTKRNAAVTAAYAAVHESYDQYRDRVREEVGDEKEYTIYHEADWKDVEGTDGKVQEIEVGSFGPYTRWFDETNPNWQNNAEMNRIFLKATEEHMNHRLHAYGHVFLNEVYDALGMERTQIGTVVGWVIGGDGDDYVDFGAFEAANIDIRPDTGGPPSVLLDFNVDGVVFDLI